MKSTKIALILVVGLLGSCAGNPHYDSARAHHTESGFKNIYYQDNKGLWAFLKWRWQKLFKDIPEAGDYNFQLDTSQHHLLKNNVDKTSLTWIGHATFLIQLNGLNILTDPQFSNRASPVNWAGPQRVIAPAMSINNLPDIDAVIISHDHYDSLDVETVKSLVQHNTKRTITFLVPLGIKSWFDELDIGDVQVVELDWSQSHTIKDIQFIAEPSQHWSKRTLFDSFERLWASWVIKAKNQRIFFAGDTGYADHFKQIGNKYDGFDLALLPIGAYEPRWFMKSYHVNPDEAVKIHMDIKSRYSVAMHWGTFILTDESLDEPPLKLREALKKYQISKSEFEIYTHGETRFLEF